jgi:glyoxylase-like metal-dependent hydrolase (beta-lactamase superfamily II)
MTHDGSDARPRSGYSNFQRISLGEEWFEVYEIAPDLLVFHEPRHYEGTIVNLVIGRDKAALIDTGCGIGNLRQAVEAVTDKPVIVVNTHTHLDHLGGNRQFDDIAMLDHPLSRRLAKEGASSQVLHTEILEESLVTPPWPQGFDPSGRALPPFQVKHWLQEGDRIELGGRDLE